MTLMTKTAVKEGSKADTGSNDCTVFRYAGPALEA